MASQDFNRQYNTDTLTKTRWTRILLKTTTVAGAIIQTSSFSPSTTYWRGKTSKRSDQIGCSSLNCSWRTLVPHGPLHKSFDCDGIFDYRGKSVLCMTTENHKDYKCNERDDFRTRRSTDPLPSNILRSNANDAKISLSMPIPSMNDLFNGTPDKPWILTQSQIKDLNVNELREACAERNLIQRGRKEDLKNRLMKWSSEKESEKNNNTGFVDYRVLPLQSQRRQNNVGKKRMDRLTNLLATLESNSKSSSIFGQNGTIDEEEDEDELFMVDTHSDENLALLTRTYNDSPHTPYTNRQLNQLYTQAKVADIEGDVLKAKRILVHLAEITPHDGRIVRRLARLHSSRGDFDSARDILQKACSSYPENPHLWHGLAQLESTVKRNGLACKYFAEAISADPTFPNSYHAWGRLEHMEGNIQKSMSILRKGIKYCPTNHRLYHALGSLYLEANLFKPAEEVLRKGMKYGPNWSQSFFYTSMAHVAYEMEGPLQAEEWLRKSVTLNPMHAQGWNALGELLESEGNMQKARDVYNEAIAYYEDVRLNQNKSLRQGDKWRTVYMNWASMEADIGNYDKAGEVYLRAAKLFPKDWNILTTFAITMAKGKNRLDHKNIKSIYERACVVAGSRHANPYRQYALYEISLSNHLRAKEIFYIGAESIREDFASNNFQGKGAAALYYDWGLLEFEQFQNQNLAKILFFEALRLASTEKKELRAKIYYQLGLLEFSLQNYYVAKHFACLSISENENDVRKEAWELWANVADELGQSRIAMNCREQSKMQERKLTNLDSITAVKLMQDPEMKKMLCKTPWKRKLMYNNIDSVKREQ